MEVEYSPDQASNDQLLAEGFKKFSLNDKHPPKVKIPVRDSAGERINGDTPKSSSVHGAQPSGKEHSRSSDKTEEKRACRSKASEVDSGPTSTLVQSGSNDADPINRDMDIDSEAL